MTLFISKLLSLAFYPLSAAILLAGIALVLARFRRTARVALVLSIAVLWVASTPAFSNWLVGSLEAQYPPRPIENLPSADVAILLGGALASRLHLE